MENGEIKHFAKAMSKMFKIFGKDVDLELIECYFSLLEQYSLVEVMQAFKDLAQTAKWFPKVAEIIEIINQVSNADLEAKSYKALKAYDRAVRSVEPSYLGNDPVLLYTVRNGFNIRTVSDLGDVAYEFAKERFRKAYIANMQSGHARKQIEEHQQYKLEENSKEIMKRLLDAGKKADDDDDDGDCRDSNDVTAYI